MICQIILYTLAVAGVLGACFVVYVIWDANKDWDDNQRIY